MTLPHWYSSAFFRRSDWISGDLDLSVFPWLALEIGPTTLSNAQGFSAENFAAVDAVQLRVRLLPLLRKQVEMDKIILKGLA